jgi:hypothetical protein
MKILPDFINIDHKDAIQCNGDPVREVIENEPKGMDGHGPFLTCFNAIYKALTIPRATRCVFLVGAAVKGVPRYFDRPQVIFVSGPPMFTERASILKPV